MVRASPVHSVMSLNCRCSRATWPKIIAPMRPLPIGSASRSQPSAVSGAGAS
jgi:hypothetical protein